MSLLSILSLFFLIIPSILPFNLKYPSSFPPESLSHRRLFIKSTLLSSPIFIPLIFPLSSNARVKGSAEYDLEYYLKDLSRSSKQGGESKLSVTPSAKSSDSCRSKSTLTLKGDLPNLALSSFVSSADAMNPGFQARVSSLLSTKGSVLTRTFVSRCGGPWTGVAANDDLSFPSSSSPLDLSRQIVDQRYFDFLCYVLWKVAGEDIGTSVERVKLTRDFGRMIVTSMSPLLPPSSSPSSTLSTTIMSVFTPILSLFLTSGLLETYQVIAGDGQKSKPNDLDPFDAYDDEDFDLGRDVNLVISATRPAWLTSALQINGEDSLFSPDFLAPTLSAALDNTDVAVRPVQTYFIDDTYRPNPTEFFPQSELLQFTFSKKPK